MLRCLAALGLVGLCLSCCGPERVAVPPLPVAGEPVAYADLVTRLRIHAGAANEAFFIDDFEALAARARDIEQGARLLPLASDAPKGSQTRLSEDAGKLAAEARTLENSAKARTEDQIRDALRKIHIQIRTLPPVAMR